MQDWWLAGGCLSSPLSQYAEAILSQWKGCDGVERSVVRRIEGSSVSGRPKFRKV